MAMNTLDWRKHDVDIAGAAIVAVVAVVGYALAIHGPLSDSVSYERAKRREKQVQLAVSALEAKIASAEAKLGANNATLESMSATLPSSHDVHNLIARIHAIASGCEVVLTRLHPTATARETGYQVIALLVEGRATFPKLHRWFARMESEVPYVDISNFSIRKANEGPVDEQVACLFECSLKFYIGAAAEEPADAETAEQP